MNELNYFGTDLQSSGHYFWILFRNTIQRDHRTHFHEIPFNPEALTNGMKKGVVRYYQAFGYNICTIPGSCSDDRGGTKSIFWTTENVEDWKELIESIPIAKQIIDQMKFKVVWPLATDSK